MMAAEEEAMMIQASRRAVFLKVQDYWKFVRANLRAPQGPSTLRQGIELEAAQTEVWL
jgi:hypothetical protein